MLKHPLVPIFFTVFVDLIGFGIIIPIIPLVLANPQSSFFMLPANLTLSDGYVLLGYMTAIFPFAQFFATPILGQFSDKFGRKPLLAFSLIGTLFSRILFGIGLLTRNLPLLFFSRALDGITGGNISVAQAAVADITTPQNRAKNFGLLGAAFGLGFILGPYIGGKLSDPTLVSWFDAATPFWFASILCFVNILFVLFLFPETLHKEKSAEVINWAKSIFNIFHAWTYKELRALFATNLLFFSGFTFFTTFFSVYLINRFHFNQGNIGDFFSYIGLWVALTQAILTRQLSKRFSETNILKFSLIAVGLSVFLYFFPTQWWQLLFIVPFFAIFNGLSSANLTALITRSAGPSVQGEVLGINASVQALAQTIPPILSGYIAAKLTPESPIFIAGILCYSQG